MKEKEKIALFYFHNDADVQTDRYPTSKKRQKTEIAKKTNKKITQRL